MLILPQKAEGYYVDDSFDVNQDVLQDQNVIDSDSNDDNVAHNMYMHN